MNSRTGLGALGRAQCSLCDITHGLVRERTDWKECRGRLAVPFDTYHLNDQPQRVRELNSAAPVIVAQSVSGVTVLLGPEEIAGCNGSPERLIAEIELAVAAARLPLGVSLKKAQTVRRGRVASLAQRWTVALAHPNPGRRRVGCLS